MAFGVIRYAHTHCIAIPEQLSVIGFDDMMMATYSTPSLTTVRQPKYELGQKALKSFCAVCVAISHPVFNLRSRLSL